MLCLFSASMATVLAVALRSDGSQAEAAYVLEGAASVAAVEATRKKQGDARLRDLLVLHKDGQLMLYVEDRVVALLTTVNVDNVLTHLRPMHPDYHGPKNIVSLQDAAGSRVTLVMTDGSAERVTVNVHPLNQVAQAGLSALKLASSPRETWLWDDWHVQPEAYSGLCELEFDALRATVLEPEGAADEDQMADATGKKRSQPTSSLAYCYEEILTNLILPRR